MKNFQRRTQENLESDEKSSLEDLEKLLERSPAHAHALVIQANLRMADALEDIADLLEDWLRGALQSKPSVLGEAENGHG